MRLFGRRWLGASILALSFSFGIVGCSGDQGAEEAVEGSENQAADDNAGGDNAAGEGENGGGGNAAAEEGAAPADAGAADAGAGDATAEAPANAGAGAGENDLQDIITEMNGQQPAAENAATETAAAPADAAPADAPGAAPAAAGNEAAASAAPAAPAAPAPATSVASAPAPSSTALPQQPGGAPAAMGLPEVGSKMAYIVERGDTLAKISQKIYGTPNHWQEMATLSGLANPSKIYPGDVIYYSLEESAVAFAKAYDAVQRAEEQVQPGDTLATISKRVYGETSGWRSIWRQNDNIDNPDVVQTGTTVFYVPKGAVQAAMLKIKGEVGKIAKQDSHQAKKLVVKTSGKINGSQKAVNAAKKLITKNKSFNKIDAHSV